MRSEDLENEFKPRMIENEDFELVPSYEDEDTWNVRILKGDFVETIIQFGTISMDDEGYVRYNFNVISSPDTELTPEDGHLQTVVGDILYTIIENSVRDNENGNDRKTHHKQHTQE